MLANGVAGVNGLGVPRYLRGRFTNLSDGIDTEFFRRANARPLADPPSHPIILLPARSIRVVQYVPGTAWALNYNVTLTPQSDESPWRIDYYFRSGSTYHDEPADGIPALPGHAREIAAPAAPISPTP